MKKNNDLDDFIDNLLFVISSACFGLAATLIYIEMFVR